MDTHICILWLSLMLLLPLSSNSLTINQWCNQTPYPEPCKHFLTLKQNPSSKSDFQKLSIELAMHRAHTAHGHAKSLEPKCRNKREKSAWSDCLTLYEETIHQLNRTLDPSSNPSELDARTWLSTALTNIETCRTGFAELGADQYFMPLMSNNVSKLISNTLALARTRNSSDTPLSDDGFPFWVNSNNRKLLQISSSSANIIVAKDGSGNYPTITEAVNAAKKRKSTGRFVIYIKKGVYAENIKVGKSNKNVMFVGDGIGKTIITGSRSVVGGFTTFKSATLAVTGEGFSARDMTIRNTAGPSNHQAVALRSGSDLSVFYRCSIEGYQDTLYAHSQRQFYRECDIYGTVDFIFGNAASVFQNCNIYVRKPLPQQKNTVTAQGRTDPNQNTGFSIMNSRIVAASDLKRSVSGYKSYLGRPWKQYSRTVIMKTFIDSLIDPAGWLEWSGDFALRTLFYGEYMNSGSGAAIVRRVKWPGFKVIKTAAEASKFTVSNFIGGQKWLPSRGVPYGAGL